MDPCAGWLRGAYPELFEREQLRERLNLDDMSSELALHAHLSRPDIRVAARRRVVRLLPGHHHLEGLRW